MTMSKDEDTRAATPSGDDATRPEPDAEAAEPASPPDAELAALRGEVARLSEELAAERERHLRARAEVENTKRRAADEQARTVEYANEQLLRDLLPVADDLERARATRDASAESLRRGVEMILQNLLAVLASYGAQPVAALGEPFDPYRHEAVECVVTDEVPEETVLAELQRGYTCRGRLLRPARVRVSAAPEP